jgi:hypothetical protein
VFDMLVEMMGQGNDNRKRCADIKKGDLVQMMGNKVGEIVCVLKTLVVQLDGIGLVQLKAHNDLVVTYWHPIRVNKTWSFPCMLDGAISFTGGCDAVYSFVVRHIDGTKVTNGMIINGVECITLGHDIQNDPIASHAFFGSTAIIEDMVLNDNEGYENGLVTLKSGQCIKNDEETGLINGFKYDSSLPPPVVASF